MYSQRLKIRHLSVTCVNIVCTFRILSKRIKNLRMVSLHKTKPPCNETGAAHGAAGSGGAPIEGQRAAHGGRAWQRAAAAAAGARLAAGSGA